LKLQTKRQTKKGKRHISKEERKEGGKAERGRKEQRKTR
jgi:hypothetical protein